MSDDQAIDRYMEEARGQTAPCLPADPIQAREVLQKLIAYAGRRKKERDQLKAQLALEKAVHEATALSLRMAEDERRQEEAKRREARAQLATERQGALAREQALERERALWRQVWETCGADFRGHYPDLAEEIEAMSWMQEEQAP
jgi:hypothetical protein